VANRRFEMQLMLLFAVSALLLAGLGVYGVVACSVAQPEREIGLRLAPGAQRKNIDSVVLHDGLAPVLAGAIAGIALTFALHRVMNSLLFAVSPYDSAWGFGAVGIDLSSDVEQTSCDMSVLHHITGEIFQRSLNTPGVKLVSYLGQNRIERAVVLGAC
jgi:ABC-type antimicrobial peptide transport system permease subunit